jgi:glycosyltransferase involved in cell wall biosynthesis
MTNTPLLSVIIPCLNAEEYIECQLNALASQDVPFPWEVILVDNGSTDNSVRLAENYRDRIPLTITSALDRASPSYAQNVGCKLARADSLVIIGADDEVAPGFISSMYAALQEHEFVTSVSDVIPLNPAWARHAQNTSASTHGAWPSFAGGSALGVARHALDSVGGCPEEYGPTWDIALSIRLQQAGFELFRLPKRLLRYRFRTSILGLFRQTRSWGCHQALVYRDFGAATVPPRSIRLVLSEWRAILRDVAHARKRADIARCAVRAGYSVGRLQGSMRFRVFYL